MANTESMTRDEILGAIELASKGIETAGLGALAGRMQAVADLAEEYGRDGELDREYLLEALEAAHLRFTAAVRSHA